MAYYYSHYQSQRNLIDFLTNKKNPKQNKTPRLSFYTPELLKIFQQNSPPYYGLSFCPIFKKQVSNTNYDSETCTTPRKRQTLEVRRTGSRNLVNCSLASPQKRYSFSLSLKSYCYCSCRRHPLSDHDPSFAKPQAQSMTQRTTAGAALETELEKTTGISVSFEIGRAHV